MKLDVQITVNSRFYMRIQRVMTTRRHEVQCAYLSFWIYMFCDTNPYSCQYSSMSYLGSPILRKSILNGLWTETCSKHVFLTVNMGTIS